MVAETRGHTLRGEKETYIGEEIGEKSLLEGVNTYCTEAPVMFIHGCATFHTTRSSLRF